jgi:hypothetical protein
VAEVFPCVEKVMDERPGSDRSLPQRRRDVFNLTVLTSSPDQRATGALFVGAGQQTRTDISILQSTICEPCTLHHIGVCMSKGTSQ